VYNFVIIFLSQQRHTTMYSWYFQANNVALTRLCYNQKSTTNLQHSPRICQIKHQVA